MTNITDRSSVDEKSNNFGRMRTKKVCIHEKSGVNTLSKIPIVILNDWQRFTVSPKCKVSHMECIGVEIVHHSTYISIATNKKESVDKMAVKSMVCFFWHVFFIFVCHRCLSVLQEDQINNFFSKVSNKR